MGKDRVTEYAETLTITDDDYPRPVRLIGSETFDICCRFGWKIKNVYNIIVYFTNKAFIFIMNN